MRKVGLVLALWLGMGASAAWAIGINLDSPNPPTTISLGTAPTTAGLYYTSPTSTTTAQLDITGTSSKWRFYARTTGTLPTNTTLEVAVTNDGTGCNVTDSGSSTYITINSTDTLIFSCDSSGFLFTETVSNVRLAYRVNNLTASAGDGVLQYPVTYTVIEY